MQVELNLYGNISLLSIGIPIDIFTYFISPLAGGGIYSIAQDNKAIYVV